MKKWDPVLLRYFLFRGTLSRAYVAILAIYMLDQGFSLGQIAFVTVVGQVVSLACEVPSGAIADTLGHKRTLIIAMLGEAASALLFIGGNLPWILAGTISYYFFASLQSGTSEALFFEWLKSVGKESQHLKLLGQGKSFAWILNMLIVFIGGATYGVNHALPFIACAILFACGALAISGFPTIKQDASIEQREGFYKLLAHFPRAIRAIWSHHYVFWLVLLNALLIGSIAGSNDFQQIIFTNLGATALFVGTVYSAKRAFSVFLSSHAHRLTKFRPQEIMIAFTLFTSGYMIVTPFVSSFVIYGLLTLLSVTVLALLDIIFNDWLNQAIPSLSRVTTLSVANFIESGVGIIAASLFGLLHQTPENTFLILGSALFLVAIVPLVRLSQTSK